MSWLGNIFGIGSGNNNGAFQATGVDQAEIGNAQRQAQSGISQQQAFTNAVNAQNGLGNQSQVFNQMEGTAGQLQNIASGQGPNPALAQLAQTTGQNVAQQGALQAGQRGASGNVGLMARQIGQQGAAIQQQAAGQAASQSAQQQLAGIGALQSQQANLANLATTQAGQQQSAIQGYNQAVQGNQGQLLGLQANQNTTNAALAQANQKAGAGLIGGVLGGIGQASLAHGGVVPQKLAGGGPVAVQVPGNAGGPQSFAGRYLNGMEQQSAAAQSGGGKGFSVMNSDDPFGGSGNAFGTLARKGFDKIFSSPSTPGNAAYSKEIQAEFAKQPQYPNNFDAPAEFDPEQVGGIANPTTTLPAEEHLGTLAGGEAAASGTAGAEAAGSAAGSSTAAAESAGALTAGTEAAGGEELLALLSKGGKVQHFDSGGRALPDYAYSGKDTPEDGRGAISTILGSVMGYLAHGGGIEKVPAMVSPGEEYLPPAKAKAVAQGKAHPLSGKKIPGKAKVKGDSLKNDTVPVHLQPGGVVIPRSIMQSKDPAKNAAKFVAAVMARQPKRRK